MNDVFGRTINYLRLSVTDRCNLRCSYCMPEQGVVTCAHEEILRYEELLRISRVAAELGIEKIRITGGEPLVRKGLIGFLQQLCRIEGVREVALTTNGLLLADHAEQIRGAGVSRINVSLDSLQPDTYRKITRGGQLRRAMDGLERAERVGFQIKLNMVVMRGINDSEVEDFARLSIERPWSVRYIEYMPVLQEEGWQQMVLPGADILKRLQGRFAIEPVSRDNLCGPARPYRIHGARGSLGIITPISEHFCGSCNRIRVTSRGMAKSCLLSESAIDLRPVLNSNEDLPLKQALLGVIQTKGSNHQYMDGIDRNRTFSMSTIGG